MIHIHEDQWEDLIKILFAYRQELFVNGETVKAEYIGDWVEEIERQQNGVTVEFELDSDEERTPYDNWLDNFTDDEEPN